MRDDVSCFDFGEGRREQKYGYLMSATILLLGGGRVNSLRGLCEMTCCILILGKEGENRSTATVCLRHLAI